MTTDLAIVLVLLVAAGTIFAIGRPRMDVVAVVMIVALPLMVVLMVTGIVPNVIAALIACLLMGIFRCVDMRSAYRAIHWPTLLLIVGMLPFAFAFAFALALQRTGGCYRFADFVKIGTPFTLVTLVVSVLLVPLLLPLGRHGWDAVCNCISVVIQ
ncbi:SLC13 family permease [Microbacterium bovistercoris]|uniref:SLC13 family permease n=1 Tax=Microbacterium bovistercoris TaxID=2293570 RepID=UPI0015F24B46|nr:SLC13 family permease [Microbacterium bovistercoris]